MSYPVLTLPKGLGWSYMKSPKFSNIKQVPQSGRHPAAATVQQGTIFEFELTFKYLKQAGITTSNDVQYLQEFYEACGGGFNWFQFDPSQANLENLTVTQDFTQLKNGFFGVGDGATKTFPLWRSTSALGGGAVNLLERIQNVTALSGIYFNGVIQSFGSFTTANFPATVTFTTAPGFGVNLSWAGSYNYLVGFDEDTIDFEEFMYQLWSLKSLKLESVNL